MTSSCKEYIDSIINAMVEIENGLSNDKKTDKQLFDLWTLEIEEYVKGYWPDYIIGKRESPMLNESEFEMLYDRALSKIVSITLNGLVDKNLVEVSVNDNGEIVYGLTEDGREYCKTHLNITKK